MRFGPHTAIDFRTKVGLLDYIYMAGTKDADGTKNGSVGVLFNLLDLISKCNS